MNYKQTRLCSVGKNAYLSMRTFQLILRFGCDSHSDHPSYLSLLSMLLCKRQNNDQSFKPEDGQISIFIIYFFFVTYEYSFNLNSHEHSLEFMAESWFYGCCDHEQITNGNTKAYPNSWMCIRFYVIKRLNKANVFFFFFFFFF